MGQPVLVIDSCSDLTAPIVEDLGLEELHFPFVLADEERTDDFGRTLPHAALFAAMRDGDHPTTAQVPLAEMEALFRRHAQAGNTVIYLGFSSGLSGTFESAHLARAAVLADIPEADIRLVDTLSASIIEGLLVHTAARRLAEGASADEIVAWVERERLHVNGLFTLENLESLRRGGRISDAAAAAGTMLDIKPILTMDRQGKLVLKKSVRGRKRSLTTLVDMVVDRMNGEAPQMIAVGHADVPEDAERIRAAIIERIAPDEILMLEIGPVIGAHVGPGMVAVAFFGAER